jgi:hypothetical protein
MPCEVVLSGVDFFKMAAVAMKLPHTTVDIPTKFHEV